MVFYFKNIRVLSSRRKIRFLGSYCKFRVRVRVVFKIGFCRAHLALQNQLFEKNPKLYLIP